MSVSDTELGLMTMRDIAELCQVSRPVVTIWRRRDRVRGEVLPFPIALVDEGGRELFVSAEVLAWLEQTGRGNNTDVRGELMAHARPPLVSTPGVDSHDAVMAMLCLKALTGASLNDLSDEDLLDLADEADPDDEALYREIDGLGAGRLVLARYVDALAEAAYGVGAAADQVRDRLSRDAGQSDRAATLAAPAHELVAQLVAALAIDLDSGPVTVWDATGGATDLAQKAVTALAEQLDCTLGVPGEGLWARRRRREALIRRLMLTSSMPEGGSAVVVGQFPHAATPEMTPGEVLTAIDDIQLELGTGQRGVVLGPAAVLCDRLRDTEADQHRDDLIRGLGQLRAVIRLPAGLLPGRSRQQLGLWVLGPPQQESLADRWVAAADLGDHELTAAVIGGLVTDVVTAMGPVRIGSTHSFHFAGVLRTADLLAGKGDLVPPGARPDHGRPAQPAELVLAVEQIMRSLRDQRPGLPLTGWSVGAGDDPTRQRAVSLGSLVARRGVIRVPGTRMSTVTSTVSGGVRVLGVDDVVGAGDSTPLRIDPLVLEATYPRARRTEPGDVVFVTRPRPAAIVDRDGMSVVRYPAAVLRCADRSGIVPDVVAASINGLPRTARAWRTWSIPMVSPEGGPSLSFALHDVETERQRHRRRLRELDELSALLIDGVASGAMAVARSADSDTRGDIS